MDIEQNILVVRELLLIASDRQLIIQSNFHSVVTSWGRGLAGGSGKPAPARNNQLRVKFTARRKWRGRDGAGWQQFCRSEIVCVIKHVARGPDRSDGDSSSELLQRLA